MEMHQLLIIMLIGITYISQSTALKMNENSVWPKAEPLLFIGVISSPDNRALRDEIRSTWAKFSEVANDVVQYRFVIGKELQALQGVALLKEAQQYEDIIQVNVVEGYANLTNKTAALFKLFHEKRSAQYLMKLDDDTFPHLDKIVPFIQSMTSSYLYSGLLLDCKAVAHEGKWAERSEFFPTSIYPKYAHGPGYILSKNLVGEVVRYFTKHSNQLGIFSEDAAVGAWVDAVQSEVVIVNFAAIPATGYGCSDFDYMSQNLQSGQITQIWQNMIENSTNPCQNVKGSGFAHRQGYHNFLGCK